MAAWESALGDRRLCVVVQARMGSSRLPGKIAALLDGHTILWHVVTRLREALGIHRRAEVVVATTDQPMDDATRGLCDGLGVCCVRGSSLDVLARFVAATCHLHDEDIVVRATADNPAYCPIRTAAILAQHLDACVDYTCVDGLSYV